jgi:pimeloyl-ACP methyl ester carboxylesterase
MKRVRLGDGEVEALDDGVGEPVVLIQTALVADELLSLAHALRRLGGYRTIAYHRRGYAGSDPAPTPHSIERDAHDCHALLLALGLERSHVIGLSYSATIALQLAVDAPAAVHTLTLLEPPPVGVPAAQQFEAVNRRLLALAAQQGPEVALEEFMTMLVGVDWPTMMERDLPGSVQQMRTDARTFFEADLPALFAWRFTAADADGVRCPVAHVAGTRSGPWFRQVRELMLTWFPGAEDVVIDGDDHSLAMTHPSEIAAALHPFLLRHPLPDDTADRD